MVGAVTHTGRPLSAGWSGRRSPGLRCPAWGQRRHRRCTRRGIRALCVITGNDEAIRPWVSAVRPTVLGDGAAWDDSALDIDPVVVQAMQSLTRTINHNNTISAGFEKDNVVSTLLALHGAGIRLNGEAMQGGALAHGWSGRNPERLAGYVQDINAGKRPRCRSVLRADYIDHLRRRTVGDD